MCVANLIFYKDFYGTAAAHINKREPVLKGRDNKQVKQHYYTSVMIYHRGASLSEQHTDLLLNLSLRITGIVTHR